MKQKLPTKKHQQKKTSENSSDGEVKELGKTDFTPLKAADGEADDLKMLAGVGPVLEKKLNAMRAFFITIRSQALPKRILMPLMSILDFKGRIERDSWLDQAKKLVEAAGK